MFKFNKKLIIIISIIGLILLTTAGVLGYNKYQNNKLIESYKSQITTIYNEFTASEQDIDKLNSLKELTNLQGLYVKASNISLNDLYKNDIEAMKDYFIKENDKVISDNTLQDLNTITDTVKITIAETNLKTILTTIQDEDTNSLLYTDVQIKKYKDTINKLISSYDAKIKSIADDKAAADKIIEDKKIADDKVVADANKVADDKAAKASSANNTSREGSSNVDVTNNTIDSNNTNTSTVKKGPKPALYTVIPANDFPNDFPKDGWSWRYSEFCWYCSNKVWGGADGKELVGVDWSVFPDSGKVVGACDNAVKYMLPKPTLEESKTMIFYGQDDFLVRPGKTTLYVCLEE